MAGESAAALAALSDGLADAVAKAAPSMVTVWARRRIGATGIAWAPEVVVTADHVIEQDEKIVIGLAGGGEAEATLAGRDAGSDIAVLRVPGAGLPPIGRAVAAARVGQLVLAAGRPGTNGPMASLGVVSGLGGPWRTATGGSVAGYIRSDAVLLPGFSGGPLLAVDGTAVGMNSSQLGRGSGLAIPLAAMGPVVDSLLATGRLRRGYLGIGTQQTQLPEALAARAGQDRGLLVVGVEADTPAERGGLLVGDILLGIGEHAVRGAEDLQAALGPETVGVDTAVRVLRGGEPRELRVVIGERT